MTCKHIISLYRAAATRVLWTVGLLFAASSCNVQEWYEPWPEPELPPHIPVTLNLKFDGELPLYREIAYSRDGTSNSSRYGEGAHDMRYMVQIFSGARSKGISPDNVLTFTAPYSTDPDFSTSLELPDGEYDFFVWADYVDPGSTADKYYITDSWDAVALNEDPAKSLGHVGSNERRDAFRGFLHKTIVNGPEATDNNTVEVEMHRPMARFEFIATDLDEFLDSEEAARSGGNIDDYTIVFYYRGFMPSQYNVYTDACNDAAQGVSFRSKLERTDEGGSMGFDYVFTDNDGTAVDLVTGVYDASGTLIAQSGNVTVPLARGKNTVVKGEFLSMQATGGVAVNPGYDGDYNIEIH